MSFILDALRKSEHERQRQTGPALAEVPVAAPKPRKNVWAPVAIALLVVNLAVVGVLLIRKAGQEPGEAPASAAVPASAAGPALQSPGTQATTTVAAGAAAPAPVAPPPMMTPAASATGAPTAGGNPLAAEAGGEPMLDPDMVEYAAAAPPGPPAVTRAPASRGSVVYESLPDSATVGGPSPGYASPQPAPRSSVGAGAGLASADELVAAGVPTLNLDLHVFSTTPAERLVFVNSHKYREGDTMQEGPVVRQITPAGAILEYQGRNYLLTSN